MQFVIFFIAVTIIIGALLYLWFQTSFLEKDAIATRMIVKIIVALAAVGSFFLCSLDNELHSLVSDGFHLQSFLGLVVTCLIVGLIVIAIMRRI